MVCHRYRSGFEKALWERLRRDGQIWGGVTGADGVVRLQPVRGPEELTAEALPLIPLKKFVLPPREPLWHLTPSDGSRASTATFI